MLAWVSEHVVISIVLTPFLLYFIFCLGYFIFHRFYIIFPSANIDRLPTDFNMAYEEYFIQSKDKTKLHLWLIPGSLAQTKSDTANYTIWFMPGNDGTLSKFLPGMLVLHEMGFNICMASYRGFGKSDKKHPFEKKLRHDAEAVWSFLIKSQQLKPSNIIIYAQSIGCGLASWAARLFNPGGLILEGAFTSVPDVAQTKVPWLPVQLITTERFSTKTHIKQVTCPILIAHSYEDQPIPYAVGEFLFKLANQPKQFVKLEGEHAKGLVQSTELFTAAIDQFFNLISNNS